MIENIINNSKLRFNSIIFNLDLIINIYDEIDNF